MTKRTRAAIVFVSFMLALYQTATAETNFSSEPSDSNNERNKRPLINPGFPIIIDGQQYIVPYSTGGQYLQLCEEKNIHPAIECAKALERKNLERLLELEMVYTKYQLLQKENVALKQQNTILEKKISRMSNKGATSNRIISKCNIDSVEEYNLELMHINVDSVRKHRCHEAIVNLPKAVLEQFLGTNADTGHISEDTIKAPTPMMRQLSSRVELIHILNDLGLHGEAVELGVHRGKYSEQILSLWKPPGRLHMVDIWEEVDNYDDYDRNIDMKYTIDRVKKFGSDRYNIVKNYTTEAALLYPDNYFDFIYLDASHTYDSTRRDLQMWWPKLKTGGIFAGDDYINGNCAAAGYRFGVKDAVDEFAAVYNLRVNVIWKNRSHLSLPQWYIYKC